MLLAILLLLQATAPADLGAVAKDAVRVYLVRHGQAYSNLDPEPELPPDQLDRITDLGRAQSRRAAAALKGRGVAAVLSSPAGRAQGTAEQMRKSLALAEVRVDRRLRPLDLGHARDGQPLDWDLRIAEWTAGRDPRPTGGESLEDVGRRVLELVGALKAEHAGRSVVLVAHSDVIGAFTGQLQGLSGAKRYPFQARNGSITAVEAGAGPRPRLLLSDYLPAER